MSERSRRFIIFIGGSVSVIFLVILAAVIAYSAGRSSVQLEASDVAVSTVEVDTNQVQSTMTETPQLTVTDQANENILNNNEENAVPVTSGSEVHVQRQAISDTVQSPPLELQADNLNLLLEVWGIVDQEFDGQLPTQEQVTYGAIAGSLELLQDDFTRFVPPEIAELTRQQLEGSFEGVGAFVDLNEEGYLIIIRPIQGQPADLAGLESGDLVTHVDGEPVLGKTLDTIISEIKGPEGTDVTLTIVRESLDEPFDVTITRDLIEIPIVESEMLEDNIGYVRLTSFSSNASDQLQSALEELLGQEPAALIFDLRDNPGGFLDQSVEVADLFLPEGVVLYQRDRDGVEEIFNSDDGDLGEDIELVVLVNKGSASASEIVAGAIQDHMRGILVGETTFGKGSVQQTHTLSDGSELRVTIARWYTPDNNSIDHTGITADIEVDTPDQFGGEDDTQLQRAIDYVLEGE